MAQGRDSRGRYTSGGDPLEGLAAEAQDAAKALGDLGKAAGAAQGPLKGTGDAAEGAGKKAKEAAESTNIFSRAIGEALGDAITETRQALTDWARDLPAAAARAEQHAVVLDQLGAAYGAVQQATNGTVSAQQAAAVQQRALQSGLRLSAQELAAVTARARDFARTTGTDVNQALEQLTDQLVDPGEELRKFGVFLQTGMNAGDALRETLRQLGAQAQSTGASQVSLGESMEMASRASREASDALAGMIAQRLELRDFFVQMASWLNDAKDATNGWEVALDGVVGTLREAIGLRPQVGEAQSQSASGAFVETAGEQAAMLRRRGVNMQGLDLGQFATQATAQQRAEMLGLFTQLTRATAPQGLGVAGTRGVGGAPVEGYADPSRTAETPSAVAARLVLAARMRTLAEVAARGAEEVRRDAAAQAAAAEAARAAELARRNRAGQSSSPAAAEHDTTAQWFASRTDTAGAQSFLGTLAQRAIAGQQAARGGTIAQRQTGVDLQRQSAEAELGGELAGVQRGGGPLSDRARASAEAETRQRVERTRIIRDQREALAGLLVEAQREEDIARRMGRPVAEVNELVRQRIGLQTALAANTRELTRAQEENAISFAEHGDKILDVLAQTSDAFAEGILAHVEGSKSFVDSMEAMAYGAVRAIAKMAIVEALKEGAMALAAVATYRYDAAVAHGASAGMWAVIGGASVGVLAGMKNPNAAKPDAAKSSSTGRSASPIDRPAPTSAAGAGPW